MNVHMERSQGSRVVSKDVSMILSITIGFIVAGFVVIVLDLVTR